MIGATSVMMRWEIRSRRACIDTMASTMAFSYPLLVWGMLLHCCDVVTWVRFRDSGLILSFHYFISSGPIWKHNMIDFELSIINLNFILDTHDRAFVDTSDSTMFWRNAKKWRENELRSQIFRSSLIAKSQGSPLRQDADEGEIGRLRSKAA